LSPACQHYLPRAPMIAQAEGCRGRLRLAAPGLETSLAPVDRARLICGGSCGV
jgi:hypothetical protein